MRTCSNTTAVGTEKKKKSAYPWKASDTQGSPVRSLCFHCQPLNEVWEGVRPGSAPSSHAGTLHAPELPWVGPAFPPGAPSLLQAVTQHFCYAVQVCFQFHAAA